LEHQHQSAMQPATWQALFRRIPREQHNNLMLTTTVGIELAVQSIVRLEDEYMVVRGRLSGSTDAGRTFFIPYAQINFLGFHKAITEATIFSYYGETPPAVAAAARTADPTAEATPDVEITNGELPVPLAGETKETPLPGKEALLQRLRSRMKAK
jgi:hypothetical protein